jgi:hypothetical protein
MWSFCPNLPAAYLFAVLFGLTTVAHMAQAVIHRKGYSWVIILSALLQLLAYVFRIVSIQTPDSESLYILWFVLLLVWIHLHPVVPGRVGLMLIGVPDIYQCVRVHGGGPDDLQLHHERPNHGNQGLAVRVILCLAGNCVSSPSRTSGLVRHC